MKILTQYPTFTLVTVTYNAEATVRTTLESVARQRYPHIEHLFIDGQSTDNTLRYVAYYKDQQAAQGRTVKLLSEPDRGLYDAMNKSFEMATGDYICFLNAGDKLHTVDTLGEMAQLIVAQPTRPALLYGDTHIVDRQGHFLYNRRLIPPDQLTWKSFAQGMLVCHQSFYIRRDLCLPYDMQYRFSADFDWCIRVMKRVEREGGELLHTHLVLTDYLHEGMTTQNHRASLKERYRIMVHHYGGCLTFFRHVGFLFRNLWTKKK